MKQFSFTFGCLPACFSKSLSATANRKRIGLMLTALLLCLFTDGQYASAATPTTTYLSPTYQGHSVMSVASHSVVTLTATVLANGVPVTTGQVSFCSAPAAHCTGLNLLATAQLTSNGTARYKFRPKVANNLSYKAIFLGTSNYTTSTSQASYLSVTGTFPTTTTIAQAGTPGNFTLATTVNGPSVQIPSGTVSFLDTSNGNAVLGSATLVPSYTPPNYVNIPQTIPQDTTWQHAPAVTPSADFNEDGIPDLAVAGEDSMAILLGNGDGTFSQPNASILTGVLPGELVTGDFNGDGHIDIAYTNEDLGAITLTVLLGNGTGSFTSSTVSVQNLPSNVSAEGLLVGDFNGDGNADLLLVGSINSVTNSPFLAFLAGKSDGTFQPSVVTEVAGAGPAQGVLGDFNLDGKQDIVEWNNSGQLTILLGNGDGTFTAGAPIQFSPDATYVAVGDFNGDSNPDLAVLTTISGPDVLLGNGDGTFRTPIVNSVAFPVGPLAVLDVDGDNIPDLVETHTNPYLNGPGNVIVLFGDGHGMFSALATPQTATVYDWVNAVAVADFDGDGLPDIAATSYYYTSSGYQSQGYGSLSVFLQQANSAAIATATGISPTGAGTHLVEASYQGDGLFDPSISATTPLIETQQVTAPTFSLPAGVYSTAQAVTISDSTPGAKIYYTLNGSTPTTSSPIATGAIAINAAETLKAIAAAPGYPVSPVISAYYALTAPTPTITMTGSGASEVVTLATATPIEAIYYTTAGNVPTTSSAHYTGPLTLPAGTRIMAFSGQTGFISSPAVASVVTGQASTATPTFSLPAGPYNTAQSVAISDSTPGAKIYYTLNGSTPTTSSLIATGPIAINAAETVNAIAVAPGYPASAVTSATYTLTAPTPTITVAGSGGSYLVTIATSTPIEAIYYTTGGNLPTSSSAHYTGPFTVTGPGRIMAFAGQTGFNSSPVVSQSISAPPAVAQQ